MGRSGATLTLVLICLTVFNSASSSRFLESSEEEGLTANELCHSAALRISRISSIPSIILLLNQEEPQGNDNCRARWNEPLRDLLGVLEASAQDACSQETIDKIYEFHWYYIVGTLKKSWRKASRAAIPEPLRLFFLHFAEETARKCQHHLSERLNQAVKSGSTSLEEVDALAKGTFGVTLDALSFALVKRNNVKRYDDFFLIFDSILAAERKKGYEAEKWVDPENGELIYMPVKVSNATSSRLVQQICREKLRPVYANTVLPVMRLVDMGFGSRSERIHDDQVRGWFGFAQLCELALPVKFYSSGAVKAGQVALITEEEEAEKLELEYPIEGRILSKRMPNVEVSPVHLGDVLADAGDDKIVKQVESGLKGRGSIYRRIARNSLNRIKSELKSKLKGIFVSKRSQNRKIELEELVAKVEVDLKEDENCDREQVELVRHRRYDRDPRRPTVSVGERLRYTGVVLVIIAIAIAFVLTVTGA